MNIHVMVNEFSWLTYHHQELAKPMEEGKNNYIVGVLICMSNRTQCLNVTFQVSLSIGNIVHDFHNETYISCIWY